MALIWKYVKLQPSDSTFISFTKYRTKSVQGSVFADCLLKKDIFRLLLWYFKAKRYILCSETVKCKFEKRGFSDSVLSCWKRNKRWSVNLQNPVSFSWETQIFRRVAVYFILDKQTIHEFLHAAKNLSIDSFGNHTPAEADITFLSWLQKHLERELLANLQLLCRKCGLSTHQQISIIIYYLVNRFESTRASFCKKTTLKLTYSRITMDSLRRKRFLRKMPLSERNNTSATN